MSQPLWEISRPSTLAMEQKFSNFLEPEIVCSFEIYEIVFTHEIS